MKKIKYWENEQGDYTISEDNKECYPIYAVVEIPTVAKALCNSFNQRQKLINHKEELLNEVIARTNQKEELIIAYSKYLNLIDEELAELMSIAKIHGWSSNRMEIGKKRELKSRKLKIN